MRNIPSRIGLHWNKSAFCLFEGIVLKASERLENDKFIHDKSSLMIFEKSQIDCVGGNIKIEILMHSDECCIILKENTRENSLKMYLQYLGAEK